MPLDEEFVAGAEADQMPADDTLQEVEVPGVRLHGEQQGPLFQLVKNSNGTVSLLAAANGKHVTAENGGADALIANRTAIGTWEQFDLATV
ncbi:hypothetical protein ABZ357_30865 [Streptomyces sp. NPDC005917]|uniref:fascin domain-containing protein n=1 Tax=unclassified Streptomyces TaxID=2593676 RepID=UPI0033C89BF9